ncbi:cobalamin-binding protein [Xylanibacillus composti]|uniref:Cobalamin-binding protein n=1 Tax=Xylanibacillus composti TaxID=1572762 RepID=A0A8J4GYU9_9BACL|nr:cobalamin-binding protein [Xylanibacillus composti]MDT9725644.1 cobalamin-binding protein [Xylanibacillus composti]GIQ67738.1 cobalamin-binding protein [Xylanibacillus composti]
MRIASLCPSNTELLAYLGLQPYIVALDDYSDWPAVNPDAVRLGSDLSIDLDRLEAAKPDYILASLSVPGMERNVAGLQERGLAHKVFNPKSLQDIRDNLLEAGRDLGVLDQAIRAEEAFGRILDRYTHLASKVTARPKVYWEWWPKPVFSPGGGNWLTEISELAGAENLFADYAEASVKTNWEEVVRRNPEVIHVVWVGVRREQVKLELVRARENAESVQAIRSGRIHVLDEPLFCRPSPRLLTGLAKAASLLHPDIYPDFDGQDPLLVELGLAENRLHYLG